MTYVSLLLCGPFCKDTQAWFLVSVLGRRHVNRNDQKILVSYRTHGITVNLRLDALECRLCHGWVRKIYNVIV